MAFFKCQIACMDGVAGCFFCIGHNFPLLTSFDRTGGFDFDRIGIVGNESRGGYLAVAIPRSGQDTWPDEGVDCAARHTPTESSLVSARETGHRFPVSNLFDRVT